MFETNNSNSDMISFFKHHWVLKLNLLDGINQIKNFTSVEA